MNMSLKSLLVFMEVMIEMNQEEINVLDDTLNEHLSENTFPNIRADNDVLIEEEGNIDRWILLKKVCEDLKLKDSARTTEQIITHISRVGDRENGSMS